MESAASDIKKLADTAETSKSSLKAMQDSLISLKDQAESAKKTFEHLFDAFLIREGYNFIKEAANATEEWAFSVQKLSQLTGVSAEAAGALAGVAKEEGVSVDTVSAALGKLSLAIANHPKKFTELGIAIRDASGNLLPMEQILGNTVRGLDAFEVGTNRNAAATALLTRGFTNLLPELERLGPALNPANLERMREFLQGLGLAIDENGIARAREWEKAQADLGFVFLAFQNQIGQALLPVVKEFGDWAEQHAQNGDLKRWAEDVARAFFDLGIVIADVTKVVIDHRGAIAVLLGAYGAVNIAKGDLVAGTAEMAAGAALATHSFDDFGKSLDKTRAAMVSARASIGAQQDPFKDPFANSIITGGDSGKTYSAPTKGGKSAGDKSAEEFQKLSTSLVEQTGYESALAAAWEKGGAAVQGLIDHQKAYEVSLRLGKGATDEMRAAIIQKSLAEQEAADRAKDAEKAEKAREAAVKKAADETASIAKTLTDHIRLETELAAAYGQGLAAVQAVIDKEKIRVEVEKLGTAATQAQIAAVQQLAAADIQASNLAEQSKLHSEALKTAAQGVGNAFETAFKNAMTPGDNLLKTFQNMGAAIEDLILKALIFKPLEDALTASVSGGGGGLFGSFFASIFGGSTSAAVHHDGGTIGGSAPIRSIASAAFAGAPRMHNGGRILGLGADEVPIIAKLGETVTPAGKSPGGSGQRPIHVTVVQNISTPDVGSFNAAQGQIMADAYRHMNSLADRNT
jgi:hypothetical protein